MSRTRPRSLASLPLLSHAQAASLEAVFKALASNSRLRLLHALVRAGELRVADLAKQVGMRSQAVSNQLQRLAARGYIGSRRDGNNIIYRIVDPCVASLLDHGVCLSEDSKRRLQ